MRTVVMCSVLVATIASAAEGQVSAEPEAPRTFLGVMPLALGRGLVGVEGEQVLSPRLSARLGIQLGAEVSKHEMNGHIDNSALRMELEPGIRYYVTGQALDGPWLGAHLELARQWNDSVLTSEAGQVTSRNRDWSAGGAVLVGYSLHVSRGLTVQAGVGLGAAYTFGQLTVEDTTLQQPGLLSPFKTKGWSISERATLSLGWAF